MLYTHSTANSTLCSVQAYQDCLSNVMLSGPTLFAPLIRATHEITKAKPCRYILLYYFYYYCYTVIYCTYTVLTLS